MRGFAEPDSPSMLWVYERGRQDEKLETGLSRALIRSITIENIADLAADVAETILDSGISDDVLKNIPVFGILFKLYKAGSSIREMLFVKKVARFLEPAGQVVDLDRQRFVQEMEANPEQEQKVGEKVLLLLDRLDDFDKATMIGKLFAAYVEKKIEFWWFQERASAVARCGLPALNALLQNKHHEYMVTEEDWGEKMLHRIEIDPLEELYRAGLLSVDGRPYLEEDAQSTSTENADGTTVYEASHYTLNDVAVSLVKILTGGIASREGWIRKLQEYQKI